jgi:hypothetical protein
VSPLTGDERYAYRRDLDELPRAFDAPVAVETNWEVKSR